MLRAHSSLVCMGCCRDGVASAMLGLPAGLDRQLVAVALGYPRRWRHLPSRPPQRRLRWLWTATGCPVREGGAVFKAVGRSARELWRKITRPSPSYPDERAARAERARQARLESQLWGSAAQHPTARRATVGRSTVRLTGEASGPDGACPRRSLWCCGRPCGWSAREAPLRPRRPHRQTTRRYGRQ
jgi:hypothetical protein